MKRTYIISAIFFTLIGLVGSTMVFTLPKTLSAAFQLYLANLLLYICGAVLFLLAIRGFRETLKVAYRFLSVGASMLVGGVLVIFLLDNLKVSAQPWAPAVTELPFILMAVFFYIGIRTFAKLIWVESWLVKTPVVFTAAGTVSVLAGFIPSMVGGSAGYDFLLSIRFFNLLIFACNAVLAYKAWSLTSPLYKPAFGWFNAFCLLNVFNTICGFSQDLSWMRWFSEASILLYLLAGVVLYMTALRFNVLAYAEKDSRLTQHELGDKKAAKNSVDIVVFLARFASSPAAVEPVLDPMRGITSSATYKPQLNESQQATLAKVYLGVEDYLISKEALRKFEKKDLRQMIDLQFKDVVNEPVFWKGIQI